MARRALITGISGQDGAYLAKFLLEKGYEVFGGYRRTAGLHLWRLNELGLYGAIELVAMELLEFSNLQRTLEKVAPDEIYNLAAQSFVGTSFEQPIYTGDVDALGVTRLLEAIRVTSPAARFYQASTSEMFGKAVEVPQHEGTGFYPRSPYGVAKLYGHWTTVNYREAFGIHASCGILFNHESPLRGLEFVTRKITAGVAEIRHGRREHVVLGNLQATRDWGFAGDYVEGMWRMLQQDRPGDFVLATGQMHTVQEFAERAAAVAGFDLEWRGPAEQQEFEGVDRRSGRVIIKLDPKYLRPSEVDRLCGNAQRAKTELGWAPRCDFDALVEMMVSADLKRAADGPIWG